MGILMVILMVILMGILMLILVMDSMEWPYDSYDCLLFTCETVQGPDSHIFHCPGTRHPPVLGTRQPPVLGTCHSPVRPDIHLSYNRGSPVLEAKNSPVTLGLVIVKTLSQAVKPLGKYITLKPFLYKSGYKIPKLANYVKWKQVPVRLSGDNLQCPGCTFQRGGRALHLFMFRFIAGEGGTLRGSWCVPEIVSPWPTYQANIFFLYKWTTFKGTIL